MSAESLACPYCNARFAPTEVSEAQGRQVCPRCGEPLPGRSGASTVQIATRRAIRFDDRAPPRDRIPLRYVLQLGLLSGVLLLASLLLRLLLSPESRVFKTSPFMIGLGALGMVAAIWLSFFRLRRSNPATVKFLLVNMAVMLGLGVSYALWTTPLRRHNDPRDAPLTPIAPGQLIALAYLPADATLIAGIHVGELMQEPAGKAFLEQPQWGPMQLALKNVERWTGLKHEAIDHVALAVRDSQDVPLLKQFLSSFDKGGLPRSLTIVVRTRRPYNAASPPEALKKLPAQALHGKPLFRFQPRGLQALLGDGLVWCAGDKTVVLALWWDGLSVEGMTKTMPADPRAGAVHLAKPLRHVVDNRLSAGTQLWVAGHGASHRTLAILMPFPRLLQDVPGDLKSVETFALALRFDKQVVTMLGDMHCGDEKTARSLQRYLENQTLAGIGTPKVVTTLPEPRDHAIVLSRAIAQGAYPLSAATTIARAASEPHWVTFQMRSDSKTLFAALKGSRGLLPLLPTP
jgi:hypothetical protein